MRSNQIRRVGSARSWAQTRATPKHKSEITAFRRVLQYRGWTGGRSAIIRQRKMRVYVISAEDARELRFAVPGINKLWIPVPITATRLGEGECKCRSGLPQSQIQARPCHPVHKG